MTNIEIIILCLASVVFIGVAVVAAALLSRPSQDGKSSDPDDSDVFEAVERNEDGTYAARSDQAAQRFANLIVERIRTLEPDQDAFGPHAPEFEMPYRRRITVALAEMVIERQQAIDYWREYALNGKDFAERLMGWDKS